MIIASVQIRNLDPNSMYITYYGCMDVGPENGLGQVVYQVRVVDKSELDR